MSDEPTIVVTGPPPPEDIDPNAFMAAAAQLPPTDKRVRLQSPPPQHGLRGRSSTPRRVRSLTPLLRHLRDKSSTPRSVASSWRSITPFLKRDEKERTPYEIGPNIIMQLASYQAIFDKALVMDISREEEPPAKYIQSEHSVFDRACIMDISNVEYVYIEEDVIEEEVVEEQVAEETAEDGVEGEDQEDGQDDDEGGEYGQDEGQEQQDDQEEEQPAQTAAAADYETEARSTRATDSPPFLDLEELDKKKAKKPPPKRRKMTAAQKAAELRAKAEAEEEARLAAEEEARRIAEEAEIKRLAEEEAAAIAAAEAAAAARIAAEEARLLALELAAEEEAKRNPIKVKKEAERREKEYQDALALSRVPHIRVHLLDTVVEEGGNLKLACSVTGTDLTIKWYRDGHPIVPHEKKYRMTAVGETISLEILRTVPADSGEYMCRLHNDYGDTGNSAIVKIYDVVKSVPQLASFDFVRGKRSKG